ncbi:hypothetical protein [Salinigranum salinum]|uniref:hypothetical protein n=1 Tax=Salinigranum salinum TaxID=1364937 RepID=UPI0012606DBD|nr:hypothetical protein [Salinigranum salinum]
MCRELNREPIWVATIRLAFTQGWADVDSVAAEANLVPGRESTVTDVLQTMCERDLLVEAPDFDDSGRYLVGPVLRRSAPSPKGVERLSRRGVHQWERPPADD